MLTARLKRRIWPKRHLTQLPRPERDLAVLDIKTKPRPGFRRPIGAVLVLLTIGCAGWLWQTGAFQLSGGSVLWAGLAVFFLFLTGVAFLKGRRITRRETTIRLSQQPGGKILLGYVVANFVVLRLYGAAFLAIGYALSTGLIELPQQALNLGATSTNAATLAGLAGLILLVPMLTPSVMNRPRKVSFGLLKATILLGLSFPIYWAGVAYLESGAVTQGAAFLDILPKLIKAIAGVSVTGAILVSMATQLTEDEILPQEDSIKVSEDDLRALRTHRMTSGSAATH